MNRTVARPRADAHASFEPWLEKPDDIPWPMVSEASCLGHSAVAVQDEAERILMLLSEEIESGSTLERPDFDGMRKFGSIHGMRRRKA